MFAKKEQKWVYLQNQQICFAFDKNSKIIF